MSHHDKTASLLVEGVAFTLFMACVVVWLAILENPGVLK